MIDIKVSVNKPAWTPLSLNGARVDRVKPGDYAYLRTVSTVSTVYDRVRVLSFVNNMLTFEYKKSSRHGKKTVVKDIVEDVKKDRIRVLRRYSR